MLLIDFRSKLLLGASLVFVLSQISKGIYNITMVLDQRLIRVLMLRIKNWMRRFNDESFPDLIRLFIVIVINNKYKSSPLYKDFLLLYSNHSKSVRFAIKLGAYYP